jgi:alpha-tubulin suppressor-like RCC1 family protein
VWAWGYNTYRQLGDGTTTNSSTPVKVSSLSDVKAISSGGLHGLALKNDDTLWAWGRNNYGQLGDGTTTQRNAPVQVSDLSDAQDIDGGGNHSLAVTSSDTTPPPKVINTIPTANEKGVAHTIDIRATFSEDMDTSSITSNTFKLFKKGTTTKIAAAEPSYDAATRTATLDPSDPLKSGVTYKAVVTTGAKDTLGNRLDQSITTGLQQKAWLFTVS